MLGFCAQMPLSSSESQPIFLQTRNQPADDTYQSGQSDESCIPSADDLTNWAEGINKRLPYNVFPAIAGTAGGAIAIMARKISLGGNPNLMNGVYTLAGFAALVVGANEILCLFRNDNDAYHKGARFVSFMAATIVSATIFAGIVGAATGGDAVTPTPAMNP